MKELFEQLVVNHNPRDAILIDTCYFFDIFKKHKVKELERLMVFKLVGTTTFNAQEILLKEHKINDDIRHQIRKFLKSHPHFFLYPVPVEPGNWEDEKKYVKDCDMHILRYVNDPSEVPENDLITEIHFACK